jgi:hypothetical protein
MRNWFIGLSVALLVATALALWGGWRLKVDSDTARVYSLKGGYHSYNINYSYGTSLDGERYWHLPQFYRNDLRPSRSLQGRVIIDGWILSQDPTNACALIGRPREQTNHAFEKLHARYR